MPSPRGCALLALLAVGPLQAAADGGKEPPRGHLEPFGAWKPGEPIEERSDVPEPLEFYEKYCTSDSGHGRPVVFRGAAKSMAAMKWSTDDYLMERFSDAEITGVEYNLKETRAGGNVKGMKVMRDFLSAYNSSDIYMVSQVPKKMRSDVEFLPCLRCGGYLNFLDTNNMWMGRGGSKSVVHYDDQDNINCMLAGQKRFVFMHPSYKKQFEAHPNTKKNRFGWVDTDMDQSIPGYGAFMGGIDVDRMDLVRFPGWKDVDWSYVDLEPGDCVYIPYQWYHQVTAAPVRTINIHVWYFRPQRFNSKNCEGEAAGASPTFADCSWGYEPPEGYNPHLGAVRKVGKKPTKCRKAKTGEQKSKRSEL